MSFPDIEPVELGADGWSVIYDTPVARILFHCGLRIHGTRCLPDRVVTLWKGEMRQPTNFMIHPIKKGII